MKRKNIIKFRSLILHLFFMCCLTLPNYSNFLEIGFHSGYTKFNDTFENDFFIGSELRLRTNEGLGFTLGTRYLKTTSILDTDYFRNIPIELTLIYTHNQRKAISPYFGAGLCANFLNKPYKAPTYSYLLKAGFNFRITKNNIFYIELFKDYIKELKNDLDIQPLSLKAGLSFIISKQNHKNRIDPSLKEKLIQKRRTKQKKVIKKRRKLKNF